MNIYHVKRTDGGGGYDTYSDFVVIAEDEMEARKTNPSEFGGNEITEDTYTYDEWVKLSETEATLIGKADPSYTKKEVVCSSYHAG